MRQVGYLQRLYRDARTTEYKSPVHTVNTELINFTFNPLNAELNPTCYLLALLAHHFLHVSRIRVKSLTLMLLMSYIWSAYS